MPAPLDFTALTAPFAAGEARALRKRLLAGRPLIAETSGVQWFVLPFLALGWLLVVPSTFLMANTMLRWLRDHGGGGEFSWGAPLVTGACAVAIALLVVLTRWAIVPPRWAQWSKMLRFADANGLLFVRVGRRDRFPAEVVDATAGTPLLSDAFVDPESGLVVGVSGAGIGARPFVLVPEAAVGDDPLAPGEQPLTGFSAESTAQGVVAVRYTGARMRRPENIRRLFATADAVRRGDHATIS